MCVTIFSTTFVWNIFNSKKNSYYCPILINLEIPQQIFEKYSNIKLHKNAVGVELFHWDGQTDCPTDMTKILQDLYITVNTTFVWCII
jgi:hypothetical protein